MSEVSPHLQSSLRPWEKPEKAAWRRRPSGLLQVWGDQKVRGRAFWAQRKAAAHSHNQSKHVIKDRAMMFRKSCHLPKGRGVMTVPTEDHHWG